MFGVQLNRSEWAGLAAVVYLVLRVLAAVGLVLWWYVADARRVARRPSFLLLLTGLAVGAMAVALMSAATDWPPRGFRVLAYGGAAFAGFLLGVMFEFVLGIRMWRVSHWLTALRVPQYREQLLHGDADVRLGAAERLVSLGHHAAPARPELLAVMRNDESADTRATAARAALYSIPIDDPPPEDDAETPREARAALADPDPRVRTCAAGMLVVFRAAPPAELVPVLCDGLRLTDGDGELADVAAAVLERLGPAAEPAVGALKAAALDREHPNYNAPSALGKIGAPAVPALVEILERGEGTNRWFAADALGDMGEPARPALPALRKAAESPNDTVKSAAERAIRKLGGGV